MLLSQLQNVLLKSTSVHFQDVEVEHITSDSRKVVPGSLFIALRGYTVDGHQFCKTAVMRGAAAMLVEEEQPDIDVPQIIVPDSRLASAIVASRFYNHPSTHLKMVGVTGTNGKTTTTMLIEKVLEDAGHRVGVRGTLGKRIAGVFTELENTTPEAVELQETLFEMVEAGCKYGVMEVSSHALELRRDAGVKYHIAVFTNLTQDHLDFHETMENYRAAKGKLFSRLGNTYGNSRDDLSFAVLNVDDEASSYMMKQTVAQCVTYGIEREADVRASKLEIGLFGTRLFVETFAGCAELNVQLAGRFNVYNILAAISVGLIEGLPLAQIVTSLESIKGVPGRFESVQAGQNFNILVDYSHTPDSLEKALTTVRECTQGRVFCVVGCGGDRDRGKRPLMAQVALRYADFAVYTSDNPRTEDPERILDDMVAGVECAGSVDGHHWQRIADRRAAISWAVQNAEANDVVLIAGKGHEDYQIVGTHKHHFDDREVAREAVEHFK